MIQDAYKKILGLKWWYRVPHVEIRRRAGIDPIETIMAQRQLRWVGHIIRMPGSRLPRQNNVRAIGAGTSIRWGPEKEV